MSARVRVGAGGAGMMALPLWRLAAGVAIKDVALLMGGRRSWSLCGGGNRSGVEGMEDKERSLAVASCDRYMVGINTMV